MIIIIPARGGSTRMPRKNEQRVDGRTLWERAILLAERMNLRCLFTSDDKGMLDESRGLPCDRRLRGEDASGDVPMQRVLDDAGNIAEWRTILQPTTPQRTVADVSRSIAQAQRFNCRTQTVHRSPGHTWIRNGAAIVLPPYATLEGDEPWLVVETPERIDIDTPEDLERVRREWKG